MEFKVGDLVKVKTTGQMGKVIAFFKDGRYYPLVICIGKDTYLANENDIEPIEKAPKTNSLAPKELQGITFIFKDNKVVAVDKDDRKGIAKCHPDDNFDIELGMKLAVDRLKFRPYLARKDGEGFYGYIGEPTKRVDDFNEPLKIGDVVQIRSIHTRDVSFTFIDDSFNNLFRVYGVWHGYFIVKVDDKYADKVECGKKIMSLEEKEKYVKDSK